MTGLDTIRECMRECLAQAGVNALTAWSAGDKKRQEGPAVAVSLRGCEGTPGGFKDYLGERFNTDAQRWEEVYGRRAKLTFGLDIYSSAREGAALCQATFDAIADALQQLPAGMALEQLTRGETTYDKELGLFRCAVEAVCTAYLYAVTSEDGLFVDFEVRGERKG